jgi:hypothetical protein
VQKRRIVWTGVAPSLAAMGDSLFLAFTAFSPAFAYRLVHVPFQASLTLCVVLSCSEIMPFSWSFRESRP